MFIPSRVARKVIDAALRASLGVTGIVGQEIHYGLNYPQGTNFPACLYRMESSEFDGVVSTGQYEHLTGAQMRFVIQFDDKGGSDDVIALAWDAMMGAITGKIIDTADGDQVTFRPQGEAPLPPYNDGGTRFQRIGTIYSVTVTRGGS